MGDNFLDPAWSDYDRQVCYQTFDISEELQPGGNVFGVMLGNGLYNVPRERYFKALISFGYPKMIFKAEIEYADGTHETIVSDRAWRVTESPVTYSSTSAARITMRRASGQDGCCPATTLRPGPSRW